MLVQMYTISFTFGPTSLISLFPTAVGTTYTHETIPTMDAGVWYVSAQNFINYDVGGAVWASNSTCVLSHSPAIGGTFAGYVPKYNYFASPNTNLAFEFTPLIFTANNTNGTSRVRPTTYLTYSSANAAPTYTFYLTATKVA